MAVAVAWDVQRCAFCCRCSSKDEVFGVAGHGFGAAAFPVRGLPKLGLRRNQLKTVTRSLYSPLVESFGNAKRSSDRNSEHDLSDSGAWITSDTPTQHQEPVGEAVEANDRSRCTPEDPVAAAHGDGGHAEKLADIGHDIDMKRGARGRARAGPPSMSISQSFSSVGRHAVSHTAGAVGHPLSMSKVPGPIGFVMAFAVAVLGVKTAVKKQGLLPGTPQKICEKCEGYGVERCHVCKGRGVLTWEGKLLHKDDPCPLCFGRCVEKCSSCGGVKIRKGAPPAMSELQLKAGK